MFLELVRGQIFTGFPYTFPQLPTRKILKELNCRMLHQRILEQSIIDLIFKTVDLDTQ